MCSQLRSAASESRESDPSTTDPRTASLAIGVIMTAVDNVPGAHEDVEPKINAKIEADPSLADDFPRLLTTFEEIVKASPYSRDIGAEVLFFTLNLGREALDEDPGSDNFY